MKYDKNLISCRIKQLRKNRRKLFQKGEQRYKCCSSQEAFAEKLNIDRRTLSKWENGNSLPTLDKLLDICHLLDCNIEYFLGVDDLPYIKTVSEVSHYTNIEPKIISQAMDNPNYLDFLNFFMFPDNCAKLLNNISLSEWKAFLINNKLSSIKAPLLIKIQKAFDTFYITESPDNLTVDVFKIYLMDTIPYEKVVFLNSNSNSYKNCICIEECLSSEQYKDFMSKCPEQKRYDYFIDYIANLTFSALKNQIVLELQKKRISENFVELLDKYFQE